MKTPHTLAAKLGLLLLAACSPGESNAPPGSEGASPGGKAPSRGSSVPTGLEILDHDSSETPGVTTHRWDLRATSAGRIHLRLLHIAAGASEVLTDAVWTRPDAAEATGSIEVRVAEDEGTDGLPRRAHDLAAYLGDVQPEDGATFAPAVITHPDDHLSDLFVERGDVNRTETELLYVSAFLPGREGTVKKTLEGLREASTTGARFVVVTLDWRPE